MRKPLREVAWVDELVSTLEGNLRTDPEWSTLTSRLRSNELDLTLHLAIFVEPYLQYILDGKKTVESRFAARRRRPYGSVKEGDILLLKKSGGPICGVCRVGQVWFYKLDRDSWKSIKNEYSAALCAQDPEFWRQRSGASYATIMQIRNVRRLVPIKIPKRDRRGWMLLMNSKPQQESLFD